MNYVWDDKSTGAEMMTKWDSFIKEDPIYLSFLFQNILKENPKGCLIISTGEFGLLFRNYVINIGQIRLFPVLVLDIRFYSSGKNKECLTKEEVIAIRNSNQIIFVDDSYSTGKTYLNSKELLNSIGKEFTGGFVFNFTGYQQEVIEEPLKYFINMKRLIDSVLNSIDRERIKGNLEEWH